MSNIQSLIPKLDEISVYVSVNKPDVIIFCETWLNDFIDNRDLSISGYSPPLRCDRCSKRGGGVCVYVKNDLVCRELTEVAAPPPFIECVWTFLPTCKVVILALYVPPNICAEQQMAIIDYILTYADNALNCFDDCNLMIIGDLNQLPTSDLESTLNLQQCVHLPTRVNSILDKILIDQTIREAFHDPIVIPNFGKADHLSVYMKPILIRQTSIQIKKVYDYRESYVANFLHVLKSQPWHHLYRSESPIDEKCDLFYKMLKPALDCIPFTYVEMTSRDKPWITPVLKLLINRRYNAYRKGQFQLYNHLKKKVKVEILKAKAAWVQNMKQKPSDIWKVMQSVSTKPKCATQSLSDNFSNPTDAADALNSAFSSVFTSPSHNKETSELPLSNDEKWDVTIDTQLISRMLKSLKPRKSAGNDNLTPRLLRAAHDVLAGPLTHLFACSISMYVPDSQTMETSNCSPHTESEKSMC